MKFDDGYETFKFTTCIAPEYCYLTGKKACVVSGNMKEWST